jgi:hypothetical protein
VALYAFFHFPVPKGSPERAGKLHRQKPDVDNCLESVADALFEDDKAVPIMHGGKLYCEEGATPRTDVFLLVI